MKTIIYALLLSTVFSTSAIAESKLIPRSELPETISASKADKPSKFPGIPSCRAGRVQLSGQDAKSESIEAWRASHPKHECVDAAEIFVCASFGTLSVRCEK